jgi:dTDP-glucose 4,6-dehydratase
VLITRCSNNYGPYHFPEKLIPLFVHEPDGGKKVPLYGDGMNVRDWLYVEDHCEAIWTVLNKGKPGRGLQHRRQQRDDQPPDHRNRPEGDGQELGRIGAVCQRTAGPRPALRDRREQDQARARWEPEHRFEQAIKTTIQWYRDHESWWRSIKSGEYLKYYEQQYVKR